MLLAPPPLAPDASRTLFATGADDSVEQALESSVPIAPGRWRYVYVHHSRTEDGNAAALARDHLGLGDHFLIGNGRGCADGEIQVSHRWDRQLPAAPAGANVSADCISICVVGDFDRSTPTSAQLKRLEQLIHAIGKRCGVPSDNVLAIDRSGSAAGLGRNFPAVRYLRMVAPQMMRRQR